jgi:hypothetical protein
MHTGMMAKARYPLFILIAFSALFPWGADSGEFHGLRGNGVDIFFDAPLRPAALEILQLYPAVKWDLEKIFEWEFRAVATVLITRNRQTFFGPSHSPVTVAFAVPQRNTIIMDYGRMKAHPFSLEITLKHELCHLLLHDYLGAVTLPTWLEEGLCQWSSGGIGEILMEQKGSRLNKAAVTGRLIPVNVLRDGFPQETEALILAYEESKSVVEYLVRSHGKRTLLQWLGRMAEGEDIEAAFAGTFGFPLETLEKRWRDDLRREMTWFVYLSYYLYEILFGLLAIVAVYAFIRVTIRRRAYDEERDEEHDLRVI